MISVFSGAVHMGSAFIMEQRRHGGTNSHDLVGVNDVIAGKKRVSYRTLPVSTSPFQQEHIS